MPKAIRELWPGAVLRPACEPAKNVTPLPPPVIPQGTRDDQAEIETKAFEPAKTAKRVDEPRLILRKGGTSRSRDALSFCAGRHLALYGQLSPTVNAAGTPRGSSLEG